MSTPRLSITLIFSFLVQHRVTQGMTSPDFATKLDVHTGWEQDGALCSHPLSLPPSRYSGESSEVGDESQRFLPQHQELRTQFMRSTPTL